MIAIVDTSSFVSLVRYYFPFDKNQVLSSFVKSQIEDHQILLIDKVYDECRYVSKGIVLQELAYLSDKKFQKSAKIPITTTALVAPSPAKFLSLVDNNFVNGSQKNILRPEEYEVRKRAFLESADIKMILLCLNMIEADPNSDVVIVTEESESPNDEKPFKKIPAICMVLGIRSITMPKYLESSGINVNYVQ
jgi:hypothetical protein